jgi:hypothetical protein
LKDEGQTTAKAQSSKLKAKTGRRILTPDSPDPDGRGQGKDVVGWRSNKKISNCEF